MKKFLILIAVGLLAGCSVFPHPNESSQLDNPKSIKHNGKLYHLKTQNDLGAMARYVYFEKKESGSNWKSAVELLLDRNFENRSLTERIALRERVYTNTGVEHFNLSQQDGALYAVVIYAPSEQNNNWQVDVAKGMDIKHCGFVQYQYSLKIPKTKKLLSMGKTKLVGYLKKYVIDKELKKMTAEQWQWKCVEKGQPE